MSEAFPSDKAAEQAVIGIVLADPTVRETITVQAEDFYWPSHETIWKTIIRLDEAGTPVHPTTVQTELARVGDLGKISTDLIDCTLNAPPTEALPHFADLVRSLRAHRRLIDLGRELVQHATMAREQPETIIGLAEAALAKINKADDRHGLSSMLNLDAFLDQDVPSDDWVMPGRLARGERLIVTGAEGAGKSTLTRQVAVCVAAGMDPFDGTAADPQRVLLIDVENPMPIMHDRFSTLRRAVARRGIDIDPLNLWIDRRPEGLNLGDPADRLWLQRRVLAVEPALIVIGPVYKLYVGGAGVREEDLARQVTATIDKLKTEVNAAVILEHHAPHAAPGIRRELRPIGSSLWMRWPEFGLGLVSEDSSGGDRLVSVEHWRGDRDVRSWPDRLKSESAGHGMPWVETRPG